ncbi:MAG: deoxyuridine 5'-triphosphate nucleotidohydrolase [Chloroflexota bacterium]
MNEASVLSDHDIRARLKTSPPLLEGLTDADTQIQSCGVDLTVRSVARYATAGAVDFDNSQRMLSDTEAIEWVNEWSDLPAGAYRIVYNEKVNLPPDLMALVYPRSSLMRCGATVHTAVWDPGYSGRGAALLVVHNPQGFRLRRGARVAQLVFTCIGRDVERSYNGRFHSENA